MSAVDERVRSVVGPVVQAVGLDLEGVHVTAAGRRRLLRVVVDGDAGVPLDTVAEVARLVSDALDDSDAMGGMPYVLEVTSPGVDRPLTAPRHWRRAVRRLVRADLLGGGEIVGRVTAADDTAADLLVDGEPRRLYYADVVRAGVQVEFNRPTEPIDQLEDLEDDPDEEG